MRRWWRRASPNEECHEPLSHLGRSMAYEVAVVVVTAVAMTVLLLVGNPFVQLEDFYIKARGTAPTSGQVAVLSLGEEAFYLWDPADPTPEITPRALLAEVVAFADAAGASVIVLDVLLDTEQPGDEALLTAAMASRAPVIAAERFVLSDPQNNNEFVAGVAPSLSEGIQGGFANLQEEEPWFFADTLLVRRAPLVREVAFARLQGKWPMNITGGVQADRTVVPSMTLLAAWTHAHPGQALVLDGCPEACGVDLPELRDAAEPIAINFRGPEGFDGIQTVRGASVLRAAGMSALMGAMGQEMALEVPPDLKSALAGKVVVVGRVDQVASSEADRFATPYSLPLMTRNDMAGVRVQAHVIDQLISGAHIRHSGRPFSWFLGLLFAVGIVVSHRFVRDDVHVLVWSVNALVAFVVSVFIFRWTDGLALELGPLLACTLLTLSVVHIYGWSVEESRRT